MQELKYLFIHNSVNQQFGLGSAGMVHLWSTCQVNLSLFTKQWSKSYEDTKEKILCIVLFKAPLASRVLMFHWPTQLTWSSPDSMNRETETPLDGSCYKVTSQRGMQKGRGRTSDHFCKNSTTKTRLEVSQNILKNFMRRHVLKLLAKFCEMNNKYILFITSSKV